MCRLGGRTHIDFNCGGDADIHIIYLRTDMSKGERERNTNRRKQKEAKYLAYKLSQDRQD